MTAGRLRKALGARWADLAAATAAGAARHARAVLAGVGVVTALLGWFAVAHLGIDSSTADMLDPKLHFLQLIDRLDHAFPQNSDLIVAVIDAHPNGDTRDAARRLAARLRENPALYPDVSVPGASPFFAREGLLYLSEKELWDLSQKLAEAQPFLGTLSTDPTLHGLASIIGRALGEKLTTQQQGSTGRMLDRFAGATRALAAGRPGHVSWRHAMLAGSQLQSDANRTVVLIRPRLDHSELRPGKAALDDVRAQIRDLGLDAAHGLRVRLTGSVAIDDQEMQSVTRSSEDATVASMLLVILILALGLRSPRLIVAILVNLVVGLVWTAAFATAAVGKLNLISVTFAVLFIGLGVDFGIQFGMRFREELAHAGQAHAALLATAREMGGAITLAATAAALSFFSFLPTAYRGLAELGLISGVGMLIAVVTTFTVMPAMLAAWPLKLVTKPPRPGILGGIGVAALGHRRTVAVLTVAVALASAATLPRVHFDLDPINLKDPTSESVRTFHDLLKDPNETLYTISVLEPTAAAADAIAKRLERLPEVDRATTISSLVPDHQQEKLRIIDDISLGMGGTLALAPPADAGNPTERRQGFDRLRRDVIRAARSTATAPALRTPLDALAGALDAVDARLRAAPAKADAMLADLEHRLVGDLPAALADLADLLSPNPVTLASLPKALRERYVGVGGVQRVDVVPKANLSDGAALRRFVAAVRAVAPNATDTPVALVDGGRVVVGACAQATALAVVAAAVLLTFVLGSAIEALIVLVPLGLALLMTAATSAWIGVPFNFANVIAVPLLLGLGIAFGIYMVTRLREGIGTTALYSTNTPRAVLFSALTTIAAFGALAFSPHRGMSSMGTLLTVALCYALLCCLVVLPAVLGRHLRGGRPESKR